MQAKVPDSLLEKIAIDQEEIILNGSPRHLTGKVKLHNQNETIARVRSLALMTPEKAKANTSIEAPLYINTKLRPGETRIEHISISLTPDTPPGTYESFVAIGGKNRKVKLVVQPTIAVEAEPTEFTFQGTSPDTKHTAMFTLTNMGNLPFQIPQASHVAPLDMDMLCRALGTGFRKNKEDGFSQTMDVVTKNIKENLPGWANANVDEVGQIVAPGQSILVNLRITMPKDSIPTNDYELLVRFWDIYLSFAFKSHQEIKRSKKDG